MSMSCMPAAARRIRRASSQRQPVFANRGLVRLRDFDDAASAEADFRAAP